MNPENNTLKLVKRFLLTNSTLFFLLLALLTFLLILIHPCLDSNISEYLKQLGTYPLYSFIANFTVACLCSYFSLLSVSTKMEDIKDYYETVMNKNRDINFTRFYKRHISLYCISTGLFSAIIINHQFGVFDSFYAFSYGIAGPMIIKEKITGGIINKSFENGMKKANEAEIPIRQEESDRQAVLGNINKQIDDLLKR